MIAPPPLTQPVLSAGDARSIAVEAVLAEGKSGQVPYRIVKLAAYGRAILLDDLIQSTEFDEAAYHEMLVAPACAWHGNVRHAVVLGGANGGIVNRLQHLPRLKSLRHFDIDPIMASLSRHHMRHLQPTAPQTAYDYIPAFGEPAAWIANELTTRPGKADLVILDLPDATDGHVMSNLFTATHFSKLVGLLSASGVLVTHIGHSHPADLEFQIRTLGQLHSAAPHVIPFHQYIPSLGVPWGFALASRSDGLSEFRTDIMASKIAALPAPMRRTYDFETHQHIIHSPAFLRQAFARAAQQGDGIPPIPPKNGEKP